MGSNPSTGYDVETYFPVYYVSWNDVQDFIDELNSLAGQSYRLCTEAEWEYAARAGTTTTWYCGDDESCVNDIAWHTFGNSFSTHRVGQKEPNAWGLYDMSGNVAEWVQDWYATGYYAISPTTDPQGPSSGEWRVNRGGTWGGSPLDCRSSSRGAIMPDFDYGNGLGFRLCMDE